MNLLKRVNDCLKYFMMLVGALLLALNIYGLTQNIRPTNFTAEDLRFPQENYLSYQQSLRDIEKRIHESESEYVGRLAVHISNSIAHIHWNEEADPFRFNQRVPLWENYILSLMGEFSGIPEYEKYHFIDYKRSLKRGIGICGDASMIASQLLSKAGIDNSIVSFPRHVVVAVKPNDSEPLVLDADYGVILPLDVENLQVDAELVQHLYSTAGYDKVEASGIASIYQDAFQKWSGVQHFVTKKYYFEYVSYFLKWIIPIVFLLISIFLFKRNKYKSAD